MVFNIVARNQNDHAKSTAFLMDKLGQWFLSPAFGTTYSFNPEGAWTPSRQTTMNGKRGHFTMADFKACARKASMKRGRVATIVAEVQGAVAQWGGYAQQAEVHDQARE